ncbi:MAG: hypothetical protein COB30_012590 [Ectothiorhodospiraceae bacterium]|nr:hypothetical protein [Ectothiorhodospiraceae bacterium]
MSDENENITELIQPRRMTEKTAAFYVGRSVYWLRNTRKDDDGREAVGDPRLGPPYVRDGRTPFYFREDLDLWLDQKKLKK